jgi:alpha-tubulin suppressor-like RCC1 family protein
MRAVDARNMRIACTALLISLVCMGATADATRAQQGGPHVKAQTQASAQTILSTQAPTIASEAFGEGAPTTAVEGITLRATSGSWSGLSTPTYAYQWLSCTPEGEDCTEIAGATNASFTPTSAQLGHALEVEVSASVLGASQDPTQSVQTRTTWVKAPSPAGGSEGEAGSPSASETHTDSSNSAEGAPGTSASSPSADATHDSEAGPGGSSQANAVSARTSEVRGAGGDAVSWGQNDHSELGAGYEDDYEDQPVPVVGLSGVTQVLAGDEYSLVLLDNGTVRSFGDNDFGQLGDGEEGRAGEDWSKAETSVQVSALSGVRSLAAAGDHVLALLEDGTVEAWGANAFGQLGDGSWGYSAARPHQVPGLSHVIAVAAASSADYALLSNHTVMAWGENSDGELGIGQTGPQRDCFENRKRLCSPTPHVVGTPVLNGEGQAVENQQGEAEVTTLTGVREIAGGVQSAYALLEDGRVLAWGSNARGQLGTGGEDLRVNVTPEEVRTRSGKPLEDVTEVSAGTGFALALLTNGTVYGWGRGGSAGPLGEVADPATCLGGGACVKSAAQLKGLEDVSSISAGEGYALALGGGTVYGLGGDGQGQLGDGRTTSSDRPTRLDGLSAEVSQISASVGASGVSHSLALLRDGVKPPAALLSVEPGPHSLQLAWDAAAPEENVFYRAWNAAACERLNEAESGAQSTEAHSGEAEEGEQTAGEPCAPANGNWLGHSRLLDVSGYHIGGLVGQAPYLMEVKSHDKGVLEKSRYIVGTPLP